MAAISQCKLSGEQERVMLYLTRLSEEKLLTLRRLALKIYKPTVAMHHTADASASAQ